MTVHQSKTIPACGTLTVVPRKEIRRPKGIYKRKFHFLQAQRIGDKLADRKKKVIKDHSQTESAEEGTCEDTERKRPREGYPLSEITERGYQDTERKRVHEGHSLPGENRGGTCQGTEKSDQVGGTHSLNTAEEGTCQNKKRN